ncbi:hypothetical protein SODALDRAFT_380927 [Sodiomyces alkalinus F11]|uniref:Uncharacterized protein n=1 Tax=Sodiomyces alkalinus (strain CBS 110278 / VKM F-3762 / F11) TaxID=1314773 RepID=A0A3N2PQ88_SODAK|nr:hypothetical protein SODALDRAFT_380927 [Sodiomyces alkalinus F11]ROT36624.1 hypothetical protein SODALDRAFT_380927 [Sodiomyces alkalinus F11]
MPRTARDWNCVTFNPENEKTTSEFINSHVHVYLTSSTISGRGVPVGKLWIWIQKRPSRLSAEDGGLIQLRPLSICHYHRHIRSAALSGRGRSKMESKQKTKVRHRYWYKLLNFPSRCSMRGQRIPPLPRHEQGYKIGSRRSRSFSPIWITSTDSGQGEISSGHTSVLEYAYARVVDYPFRMWISTRKVEWQYVLEEVGTGSSSLPSTRRSQVAPFRVPFRIPEHETDRSSAVSQRQYTYRHCTSPTRQCCSPTVSAQTPELGEPFGPELSDANDKVYGQNAYNPLSRRETDTRQALICRKTANRCASSGSLPRPRLLPLFLAISLLGVEDISGSWTTYPPAISMSSHHAQERHGFAYDEVNGTTHAYYVYIILKPVEGSNSCWNGRKEKLRTRAKHIVSVTRETPQKQGMAA